jgi:hypothetical protein
MPEQSGSWPNEYGNRASSPLDTSIHAGPSRAKLYLPAPDIVPYQGLQAIGGVGASPQEAVSFVLSSMAVGRALVDKGADVRAGAEQELIDLFAGHHVPENGVMMQGKAWLVSARV